MNCSFWFTSLSNSAIVFIYTSGIWMWSHTYFTDNLTFLVAVPEGRTRHIFRARTKQSVLRSYEEALEFDSWLLKVTEYKYQYWQAEGSWTVRRKFPYYNCIFLISLRLGIEVVQTERNNKNSTSRYIKIKTGKLHSMFYRCIFFVFNIFFIFQILLHFCSFYWLLL